MSTSTPSIELFAPADAIPILTSGRNTSGYSTGHEPKFVLDNDPDTYWEADSKTDHSIYIDLGTTTDIDALVFWLHNYNENYSHTKSWVISYSHDDSSYNLISTESFIDYRTTYTPLVVAKFPSQISARYWKIDFSNFDVVPIDSVAQISCIWFTRNYPLPYKHQHPESNSLLYANNGTVTRSGHRFSSPAGYGKQKLIQRDYIFTASTDQWDNLKAAYDAARGKNLPIIFQSKFDSDEYAAVHFHTDLVEGRDEHEFRIPHLVLKELGHERVPYTDKTLPFVHLVTVGHYRFNGDGVDESGRGNDLTLNGYTSSDFFRGPSEQNNTAFATNTTDSFSRSSADSTDFDMGTSDFTIEVWVLVKSSITGGDRGTISKRQGGPTTGWRVSIAANYRLAMALADGSSSLFPNGLTAINDDKWHLHTMVITRGPGTLDWYIDGVFDRQSDISALTGDISATGAEFTISGATEDDVMWWDELCISKRDFTATEIANRYAGRTKYGNWGM